jgi:hypothetical protein
VVDQFRNQACVEAMGAQQRLRRAIMARGRERGRLLGRNQSSAKRASRPMAVIRTLVTSIRLAYRRAGPFRP